MLLSSLGVAGSGCGLLQLPLAIVGAALSIVQIPLSLALSLIGPATKAATTAAPYALLLTKLDEHSDNWDLLIFQNETGRPNKEFFNHVSQFSKNHWAALSYPPSSTDLKKFVQHRNMRCYLVCV